MSTNTSSGALPRLRATTMQGYDAGGARPCIRACCYATRRWDVACRPVLNPVTAEVTLWPQPPSGHCGSKDDLRPVQELQPGRRLSNAHANRNDSVASGDVSVSRPEWTSKAISHVLEREKQLSTSLRNWIRKLLRLSINDG